jgi:hypothetical protein
VQECFWAREEPHGRDPGYWSGLLLVMQHGWLGSRSRHVASIRRRTVVCAARSSKVGTQATALPYQACWASLDKRSRLETPHREILNHHISVHPCAKSFNNHHALHFGLEGAHIPLLLPFSARAPWTIHWPPRTNVGSSEVNRAHRHNS